MKTINEYREMSIDNLRQELIALRREQLILRITKVNGSLDKTHVIPLLRKAVAQIKTLMTQKAGK